MTGLCLSLLLTLTLRIRLHLLLSFRSLDAKRLRVWALHTLRCVVRLRFGAPWRRPYSYEHDAVHPFLESQLVASADRALWRCLATWPPLCVTQLSLFSGSGFWPSFQHRQLGGIPRSLWSDALAHPDECRDSILVRLSSTFDAAALLPHSAMPLQDSHAVKGRSCIGSCNILQGRTHSG